ncbi:hypothetical protein AXK56_02745 [Tsukamurella pulmonis]|uniref:Uncharacterized protein n=1 Tax=Tsukamurella pulmonis TaxID=47312 RepID=A0A1H1EAC1_9ACTN|nr:hypothetical protein [Tsukamurella pulmonis]KXO92037.1 hypothetical protein AXK56_02745 [Tsukamurella pulmonis]SDQ85106.1 hypothetical protein SAMN04489765_2087 [Tsukamurella pulmonis]SUP21174.1 Uncharacterised protein [Tsukamurella pulmonis]
MKNVALIARTVALTLLLAGALAAIASMTPRTADAAEFAAALEHDEVVAVQLTDTGGSSTRVRSFDGSWATGPFEWRRGPLADDVSEQDFRDRLAAHDVEFQRIDRDQWITWPFRIPTWFGLVVATTWGLTFVAMIASRPTYGNRWAWFWLFTIGQIGALAYLLLEPVPLRRALDDREFTALTPARDRWTGLQGCLASPVAAFAAATAATVLGWALSFVLP